jgi:hypothetical protein
MDHWSWIIGHGSLVMDRGSWVMWSWGRGHGIGVISHGLLGRGKGIGVIGSLRKKIQKGDEHTDLVLSLLELLITAKNTGTVVVNKNSYFTYV